MLLLIENDCYSLATLNLALGLSSFFVFLTFLAFDSGEKWATLGWLIPSDFTPAKNRILSTLPKLMLLEPPPLSSGSKNVVIIPHPGGFGGPYPASSKAGIFGVGYFPFEDLRVKSGFLIPAFIFSMSFYTNLEVYYLSPNWAVGPWVYVLDSFLWPLWC